MLRPAPSVLHALAGAAAAAAVALPVATGTTSLPFEPSAAVEPLGPTTSDLAREGVAGSRADAAVAAVQAQREAEALAAEQARIAAERAAAEEAERASRAARSADPKSVAQAMLAERGQADQFGCLERLWTKESGWDHTATNRSSGAYGIPQSLPAAKMASAGADWRTNPVTQIRWGLGYIADRYGSPCAAWRHSQNHNWY
jgi:hypothetical protein